MALRWCFILLGLGGLLTVVGVACGDSEPTPAPALVLALSPTLTSTLTPEPTSTPISTSTPEPTPTPAPTPVPGSDYMYVWDIDMFHKTKGRGELVTTITIHEDGGAAQSGATVNATLTRPDVNGVPGSWNWTVSTNGNGEVLLKLKFPISGITYTMCVNDVTHSHTYDSAQNVETCETIDIP